MTTAPKPRFYVEHPRTAWHIQENFGVRFLVEPDSDVYADPYHDFIACSYWGGDVQPLREVFQEITDNLSEHKIYIHPGDEHLLKPMVGDEYLGVIGSSSSPFYSYIANETELALEYLHVKEILKRNGIPTLFCLIKKEQITNQEGA